MDNRPLGRMMGYRLFHVTGRNKYLVGPVKCDCPELRCLLCAGVLHINDGCHPKQYQLFGPKPPPYYSQGWMFNRGQMTKVFHLQCPSDGGGDDGCFIGCLSFRSRFSLTAIRSAIVPDGR